MLVEVARLDLLQLFLALLSNGLPEEFLWVKSAL